MKKVFVETTTRLITNTEKVTPQSASWAFVNTGTATLIINNNYPLLPGAVFSSSTDTATAAALLLKGIELQNKTTFQVNFDNPTKIDVIERTQGKGHLIETHVRLS